MSGLRRFEFKHNLATCPFYLASDVDALLADARGKLNDAVDLHNSGISPAFALAALRQLLEQP